MSAASKFRKLLPYLVPLVLLVVVVLLYMRMQSHRVETNAKSARDGSAPIPVDVIRATKGEVAMSIPTECVAQANPLVRVSNPAAGRPVAQTRMRVGDMVTSGALLLTLDDREESTTLKNAEEMVKAMESYVKAARDRMDYFSAARTEGLGLERDAKQAAVDWSRAVVELANARADVRKAQGDLERTRVRSPVSGGVMGAAQPGEVELSRVVGESATARASGGVAAIGVIDPILIECDLPEDKLSFIRPSQVISASFPSLPGQRFQGRVARVNPGASQDLRTVGLSIELANPKAQLLPGAHGLVEVQERWEGLRIPSVALVNPRTDIAQIFVVDDKNVAHLRKISVGGDGGGYVQILSGLEPGEQVVVVGQVALIDGDKVRIGKVVDTQAPR